VRIFLLFIPSIFFAQGFTVISELDTTKGYIGDIINWSILIEGNKNRNIQFPEINSIDEKITVRKKILNQQEDILNKIYFEIVVWDTGTFFTPNYTIEILNNDGSFDYSIDVQPIEFTISSILSDYDKSEFRPMKGPVPVKDILPLKLITLSLLLLFTLAGMIFIWKKRQKIEFKKIDYAIIEIPKDRALRRLNELDKLGLTKEYYTILSHIIREFMERKYFVRALEMTTDEIENARAIFPIDDASFSEWIKFLYDADQVKYARIIPTTEKLFNDKEKIITLINTIEALN